MTPQETRIYNFLLATPESLTNAHIAASVDMPIPSVRRATLQLERLGKVRHIDNQGKRNATRYAAATA